MRESLRRHHEVDVEFTASRADATKVTRNAVRGGAEAIVVVGGDGTLAETYPALAGGDVPLGVIPGGGTNVLARSLGIPEKTSAAIARLEQALGRPPRRIGLGVANGRRFAFCAGMGFDAAAVRMVERRTRWKRSLSDLLYLGCALQAFASMDRRRPALVVDLPDGDVIEGVHHLMVGNSSPYTYVGALPLILMPGAHVDRPLALAAFHEMTLAFTLRMLVSALSGGQAIQTDPKVSVVHDLSTFAVRTTRPVDFQLDGDHAGSVTAVSFSYEPATLPFLA